MCFTQSLGSIGSAVLTYWIGHKRTNRRTDKQNIYIEDFLNDNIHAWTGYEMALFKPLVNQQLGNLLWILIVFLGGGGCVFSFAKE